MELNDTSIERRGPNLQLLGYDVELVASACPTVIRSIPATYGQKHPVGLAHVSYRVSLHLPR
jgi:hypothetical protein